MMETSPHPASSTSSVPVRRGLPAPLVVALVLLFAAIGSGIAWWLQDARVQAREQARAEAAAQLEKALDRIKTAEAASAAAAQQLKQAQVTVDAATKQATDATAQLDAARRDTASARAERDQARASEAATKSSLERMRTNDLDPGLLPAMELAKVFGGLKQVRAATTLQMNGSAAAIDPSTLDGMLQASLAEAGLAAAGQSPFQVRLFVTIGPEKPRHPVGLLLMVMRTMKVPGETGSREVAIWGQQRTAQASDEESPTQVQLMVQDLCRELGAALGVKASAASSTPAPVRGSDSKPAPSDASAAPAAVSPAPAANPAQPSGAPAPAPASTPTNAPRH